MTPHFQAIIIGAGQAGLAAAHELARRGLVPGVDFAVLDANEGPGGAWRHRWDSLTLGKAHGIADLPGLPMKRPDPTVPSSTLVTEYYGDYEDTFDLKVIRPAKVSRVEPATEREPAGPLRVISQAGEFTTDVLLNSTGTWDNPYVPYIPGIEDFEGLQLHTRDYVSAEEFRGRKTLVVGGGLSAIQFLLELEDVTETVWATRRPPNFTNRWKDEDKQWGLDVEDAVRERTFAGERPASVVRTTGIGMIPDYVDGVRRGLLVSRGMFDQITPNGVIFGEPLAQKAEGLGPSENAELVFPESWAPFPAGTVLGDVDVIFWNTGFRPSLRHLAPLKLRSRLGGIEMADEVTTAVNPRVLLVGYGSTASTIGATRAGRKAGRVAHQFLRAQA
ncbi:NAD(P)-binding domain-containing protein [Corynebacterium guangdongense]|uniref:Cation diffusion facilitator CzcD-associated flavoprotein CzcO n=1 Tax=Corynebacterium guangdongense TaxID=1783348 RepID=A0ABU1ZZK9_9CORY|nr:NAD(P)-binding domain-containing protein [Corynebacterium guangdongense]MDR7330377.1 cation diffusion facilitator CzcD-associated flavoprotein CzcO [Corynebacterium guangdongense]WJZ18935.1 putative oxidoreductase CzcO [Corynebacterium guangdongense]